MSTRILDKHEKVMVMNRVERTELREILTEEEKQRRRKDVEATFATHAIEGIYPTEKTKRVFEGYIEGIYDMDDVVEIMIGKKPATSHDA